MTDSIGWRQKLAVLIPSTNTSVQPEFDAMRPSGVSNHISRIQIPNIALNNDDDFNKLIELIQEAQTAAVVGSSRKVLRRTRALRCPWALMPAWRR